MARRPGLRALLLGSVSVLQLLPPAGASASAADVVAADDTATVCRETGETVNNGLKDFVTDMQQVSTKAQAGDLAGAEATVQHAGTILTAMATKLREQGDADDPALRRAVADLATEIAALGGRLNGLAGLRAFDTTKLSQLAENMAKLCGASPSPFPTGTPSPGSPSPSISR